MCKAASSSIQAVFLLVAFTMNCTGTTTNLKKPVEVEPVVDAIHSMLASPDVHAALKELKVHFTSATLGLHTATTATSDVSVTFIGSLEGELDVTSVQELTLKFAPPPDRGRFAALVNKIPSAKDLVQQLELAEKAAATALKNKLDTKSVDVEFDFAITTSATGGFEFKPLGIGVKGTVGIKREEMQKLILSFEGS